MTYEASLSGLHLPTPIAAGTIATVYMQTLDEDRFFTKQTTIYQRTNAPISVTNMPTTFYCTRCLEPLGPRDTNMQKCKYCPHTEECCCSCASKVWQRHMEKCEAYPIVCSLHPTNFYNEAAGDIKSAQRFAELNNHPLPKYGNVAVLWPIFSLVFTGQDTEENLQLLLGPNWRSYIDVVIAHEETRIELLMGPEPGSPSFVSNRRWTNQLIVDGVIAADAFHRVTATAAEKEVMSDIRNTRELIKMCISAMGMTHNTTITRDDLVIMFSSMLPGDSFDIYWRTIKLAASIMNQGLQ